MFPVPPGAGPKALNDVPLGPPARVEEHGSMPFVFESVDHIKEVNYEFQL